MKMELFLNTSFRAYLNQQAHTIRKGPKSVWTAKKKEKDLIQNESS